MNKRYRLIFTTGFERHISPIVLTEEEVKEQLALEARLHRFAGWTVKQKGLKLFCNRGHSLRTVEAKSFDPFDDTQESLK